MRYDIPALEGETAKRYAAQDEELWRWVAAVLREEHRRQQYAEEMFPQANSEIKHSRRALLDAAVSCEFRAGRIPITPAPPRLVPVRKETEMVHVKKHLNLLGMKVEDKVTGFKGVVASISFDLYGCVQAIVNPGADKDGKLMEQCWLDVSRLSLASDDPVMERPDFEYGPQAEGKQGAAEKPKFTKA